MDRDKIKDTRCRRCGHEWFSKVLMPKQCPNCKFFKLEGKPVVEKINPPTIITQSVEQPEPVINKIVEAPISMEDEWS